MSLRQCRYGQPLSVHAPNRIRHYRAASSLLSRSTMTWRRTMVMMQCMRQVRITVATTTVTRRRENATVARPAFRLVHHRQPQLLPWVLSHRIHCWTIIVRPVRALVGFTATSIVTLCFDPPNLTPAERRVAHAAWLLRIRRKVLSYLLLVIASFRNFCPHVTMRTSMKQS